MASWQTILSSSQLQVVLPGRFYNFANIVPYNSGGTPYLVLVIDYSPALPPTITFATTQATPTSATTPVASGPSSQNVNSAGANPGLSGALAYYNGYLIGIVSQSTSVLWVSAVSISGATISTAVINASFNTGYLAQGTLLIGNDGYGYILGSLSGDVATFMVFNLGAPTSPSFIGTVDVTIPFANAFLQFATDGYYIYATSQSFAPGGSTSWASATISAGAIGPMVAQSSIPVNITGPIGFVGPNVYIAQYESGSYQTTAGVVYSAPVTDGTLGAWVGPITSMPYGVGSGPAAFGNEGAYQGSDGGSTASLLSGYQLASAPLAPSLVSPSNNSYMDASTGITFSAVANSPDGAPINARAMRLKLSTAASYTYWNANVAVFQSTIVWNTVSIAPGATGSFGPISGLTDGTTINWSMADQESAANLQGPFASDFTVSLQGPVNLTVSQPVGVVSATASPALVYVATPPTGATIIGGQWLVYPLAVTQAAGFAIDIGTGTIPVGYLSNVTWTGNPQTVAMQTGITLANSQTYVAYAAVQETGAEWSSTVGSTFSLVLDAPGTPTIVATASTDATTGYPVISLDVSGGGNLLTAVDGSFETGIGTWIIE